MWHVPFILFASKIGHYPFTCGIFSPPDPKRYFSITTAFKTETICPFETLLSISRRKWCRSIGYDTIPQFRISFRFLQNPRSFSLHSYFSFISFYLFFSSFCGHAVGNTRIYVYKMGAHPFLFSKQRSSILHIGPTHLRIFNGSFVYFSPPCLGDCVRQKQRDLNV